MFAMCLFFVTSSSSLAMDSNQEDTKVKNVEDPQCVICFEAVPENRRCKTPCCGKEELCDTHLYMFCKEKKQCPLCRGPLDPSQVLNGILENQPDICRLCFDEKLPMDGAKFVIPSCGHTFCAECLNKEKSVGEDRCYCEVCKKTVEIPKELSENLDSWFYRNKTIDVSNIPGMDGMSNDELVRYLCFLYRDRFEVYIYPYYDPYDLSKRSRVIGHLGIDAPDVEPLGVEAPDDGMMYCDYDRYKYKTPSGEEKLITINDPELAKKFIKTFQEMKEREREEKKEKKEHNDWISALSYDEPYGPGCNIF